MTLDTVMSDSRREVLDEAYTALHCSHGTHYDKAGEEFTKEHLGTLFDAVVAAIRTRDLAPLNTLAQSIATERFNNGFPISEVQTAFNSLEQAMWRRVVAQAPPEELAEQIGLLSTVLGFGKDVMSRTFVSLASQRHVPTLDLRALFAGVE